MLTVDGLAVRYGDGDRDAAALDGVDLSVADREVVCVVGPSGSGKSTLLRAIAGLERPSRGRVAWDGRDLAGIPPHRRQFGLMFQDHALFPHRDVLGNVAFGLRMQRRPADDVDARARAALERVGLRGFEHRRVRELSGGEQQRVALARALAPEPRLLMLDEPLGSLDRELRERLAGELRELFLQLGVTALFVTHDQDEAFALADRIVILRAGRVEQVGDAQEVWRHPATAFAARFLGFANLIEGQVDDGTVRTPFGPVPNPPGRAGASGRARIAARPDALRLDAAGPVSGRVTRTTFRRDHFVVAVDTALGLLEVAAAVPPPLGATVDVALDPDAVVVLPET
jgi:thiamine transport system ATP-binding protein